MYNVLNDIEKIEQEQHKADTRMLFRTYDHFRMNQIRTEADKPIKLRVIESGLLQTVKTKIHQTIKAIRLG